ncbi:hypothetical protein AMTRI_Chr03g138380 [Amborella trichopoda]|uniref:C2H2-type domain-containing protein n=1 Tax=Amborella trichopoda TaxID=13333 RepID=W1PTZ6_AMBTC|nr:hypothetical protein AMTR_s00022p00139230 [Amborella trichopoda]
MDGVVKAGKTRPRRSFKCLFCGRRFITAQALGGHMNLHRRDRARLCNSVGRQFSGGPSTFLHQVPSISRKFTFMNPISGQNSCNSIPYQKPITFTSDVDIGLTDTSLGIEAAITEDSTVEELDLELRLG